MTTPTAPHTSALAVSTDRAPVFYERHIIAGPHRIGYCHECGACIDEAEFAAHAAIHERPTAAENGESEIVPGDGPKMDDSPLVEQVFFGWDFDLPAEPYADAIRRSESRVCAALAVSTNRASAPPPAAVPLIDVDQKICRQAAHMYEVGASDSQIDAYLSQLRSADDQQTFLAAYAALEVEAAYDDQVSQERNGAYALVDAELSGYDPVHERHLALTAEAVRRVACALPNVYTPAALLAASRPEGGVE